MVSEAGGYVMTQERNVYAITGVSPERLAYAMAKYSRSAQSLVESAQELTDDRTRKFLNTMYFKYGHASIADMAHLSLGVEQISIWAALVLLDEQLWDGQERSTRYQPFRQTGYRVPEGAPAGFAAGADWLMERYEQTFAHWVDRLKEQCPPPAAMTATAYETALRARAFDIARYYLFLGVNTSVGQITTARVLERQVARLQADPLPEIRAMGHDVKAAVTEQPPVDLQREQLIALIAAAPEPLRSRLEAVLQPEPLASTLVKYAEPSPYQETVWSDVAAIAAELLPKSLEPDNRRPVVLTTGESPVDAAVAALLYRVSDLAYHQIVERVAALTAAEKRDVLEAALGKRGAHDEWLREFQGAPLAFDILVDVGAYRDLHRHRRTSQVRQAFTTRHGAAVPAPMEGTPEAERYLADMAEAARRVEALKAWDPLQAHYLLPLGFKTRALFRMDLAEAGYLIKLRSKEGGHFAYRRIAYQMYQALCDRYPEMAPYLTATDPADDDPLTR
jgi:thymidylate synthase ThyX